MPSSILYYADIHGPEVIKARSIRRNVNMAGSTKVIAVCQALKLQKHDILIYSLGSPAERNGRFYEKLEEHIIGRDGELLKIIYSASIDNRLFRGIVSTIYSALNLPEIIKRYSINTIIIYNLTFFSVMLSLMAFIAGKDVYLDYEDSARATLNSKAWKIKNFYVIYELLMGKITKGVFGASGELLSSIGVKNKLYLPGILADDLVAFSSSYEKRSWIPGSAIRLLYSGGLDASKGINRFIQAIYNIDYPIEMIVCGNGLQNDYIRDLCVNSRHNVKFLGLVARDQLLEHMLWADVGINPHRSDLHNGGTWPFKVIEYLGTCGIVFCNKTNELPLDFADKLFIYKGDSVDEIRTEFLRFISAWPSLATKAEERRAWALKTFSISSISVQLDKLLSQKEQAK